MSISRPAFTRIFCNISPRLHAVLNIRRNVSSLEITSNITFISNENNKQQQIANLKSGNQERKPLVIILPWLMAKRAHVKKFADFYLQQNFDVVNIDVTPWQILWPMKGSQVLAGDIIKFLDSNKLHSPLLLHGFSVGGYLWSEVLVQLAAEQNRYRHILDRFVGQVWDSLADITELPEGFPYALFPKNKTLQNALRQYVLYHLRTFDKVATCHYIRGSQMFYTNIIKVPALLFVSKSDPIGSAKVNLRLKECWENMGIEVYWKCWENSPHVSHFRFHREEYLAELVAFLQSIGLYKGSSERLQSVGAKL